MPLKTCEEVLRLYREKYFDLGIRHFHEKLQSEHIDGGGSGGCCRACCCISMAASTAG